jgi:hypothetical protein
MFCDGPQNFCNVVAPLVCHEDAPNIAAPPFQGSRYPRRLPPSGGVVGQDAASFVRDPLAAKAGFKMEKIPRHGSATYPPTLSDTSAMPLTPIARAAAGLKSMTRPRTNEPRSLMRTTTELRCDCS